MAERSLTLHQNKTLLRQSRRRAKHRRLHRTGGVIDAHSIQGDPFSADQNSGLPCAHKARGDPGALGCLQERQACAHLADSHVGANGQKAPAGKLCGACLANVESFRLPAQIPDPTVTPAGLCQFGIIGQAGGESAGEMKVCAPRR